MDWSRAKTVLIWAFLLLNVLLGYQLWMDELNLTTFAENATRRDEMNRLLEQKEIRLDGPVPEGTPSLREITVRLSGERAEEPQPLAAPFARSRLDDAALVRESVAGDVAHPEAYEPDAFAPKPNGSIYVMNQLYGELPMFEMRLELYGDEKTVDRYRVSYAEVEAQAPSEGQTAQGQEVLSAYIVISSLAENYLPRGAVVADVRLGYHGPIFESETQVLAPYWRVVLNTGETYYVHAVNGAVEGPSAEPSGAAKSS